LRVAVHKVTGQIRILKSVQAADAGRVANPMQCRGQVEGGVAQSLGAALYEEMIIDDGGRIINPCFRDYHLPQYADVPRTEVLFADTYDTVGPMGAKSMRRAPIIRLPPRNAFATPPWWTTRRSSATRAPRFNLAPG
jgi:CO/xanthine dehydrogenase Mo-binding subunit